MGGLGSVSQYTFAENDCNNPNRPNLSVSAESTVTDNYFNGPTIVEVKICDSDISDTTMNKGEPDVTINGKILRMIQATDGNWYGYFADRNEAQQADASSNPDFGIFCDASSNLSSSDSPVTFDDTEGIVLNGILNSGMNGTSIIMGNTCSGTTLSSIPNTNSIPMINTDPNVPSGQIGIDVDAWPFIQLYDFHLTGNVVVQYNKGGTSQSVTLTFDEFPESVNKMADDETNDKRQFSIHITEGAGKSFYQLDLPLAIHVDEDSDDSELKVHHYHSSRLADILDGHYIRDTSPDGELQPTHITEGAGKSFYQLDLPLAIHVDEDSDDSELKVHHYHSSRLADILDGHYIIADKSPDGELRPIHITELTGKPYYQIDLPITSDGTDDDISTTVWIHFIRGPLTSGVFEVDWDEPKGIVADELEEISSIHHITEGADKSWLTVDDIPELSMTKDSLLDDSVYLQSTHITEGAGKSFYQLDLPLAIHVDEDSDDSELKVHHYHSSRLADILDGHYIIADKSPDRDELRSTHITEGPGKSFYQTDVPLAIYEVGDDSDDSELKVHHYHSSRLADILDGHYIRDTPSDGTDDDISTTVWIHFIRGPLTSGVFEVDWDEQKDIVADELEEKVPKWVRHNAGWWADGTIDDSSFVQGIQYLIKEDILKVPLTEQGSTSDAKEIPLWIQKNAGWWADGSIDDDSFVQGIQFLIKEGIMRVN